MSALSSAQEHNARLDKSPRSGTPSTPLENVSKDSQKPNTELSERSESKEARVKEDKPVGLADRLGPSRPDGDGEVC